jgi:uncharacterized protein
LNIFCLKQYLTLHLPKVSIKIVRVGKNRVYGVLKNSEKLERLMQDFHLPEILPVGTQVVTHIDIKNPTGDVLFVRGAVGVLVKAPLDSTHAYRVKFMDGTEVALKQREFSVQSHFRSPTAPKDYLTDVSLYRYIIYQCVVGSRAYGLDNEQSDVDVRGIYLPPADLHWSLFGVPEQLENHERQECFWELQKFITLALKANPNILECLHTPLVQQMNPIAEELLAMRSIFVSKLIYQTYNGYVMSQFKKLQKDLENHGEIRWKHAMHLIRLLISGITALKEGYVPVQVFEYREELLAIRHGQMEWVKVNEWRLRLHREFDTAFQITKLPDRPDYQAANEFLVKARRSVL